MTISGFRFARSLLRTPKHHPGQSSPREVYFCFLPLSPAVHTPESTTARAQFGIFFSFLQLGIFSLLTVINIKKKKKTPYKSYRLQSKEQKQKMTYTCGWGILATGGIASKFSKDLLVDPKSRNVDDVEHKIVAVASSSSSDRAKQFVNDIGVNYNVDCYGTYEELVNNPNIDIIYVATPHSMHYENCRLALNAGKSVLCEKAFTINEAQANQLISIAKEKNLFLMEAVWTRFFPLCIELQRLLHEEKIIGNIHRVLSDCSSNFDVENTSTAHRLLNPELGGGALLDIGVYALTWIFMIGYNDPRNKLGEPIVSSGMIKNVLTHVDETTNMSLIFENSKTSCIATTSIRANTPKHDVCRIQGDKGEISVQWAPYRPESFTIYMHDSEGNRAEKGEVRNFEIPGGMGMYYEADECARCLRDGKVQSDRMPWEEMRVAMAVLDKVRKDNDFNFPDCIEQVY